MDYYNHSCMAKLRKGGLLNVHTSCLSLSRKNNNKKDSLIHYLLLLEYPKKNTKTIGNNMWDLMNT